MKLIKIITNTMIFTLGVSTLLVLLGMRYIVNILKPSEPALD
jgi:hypothetical protein